MKLPTYLFLLPALVVFSWSCSFNLGVFDGDEAGGNGGDTPTGTGGGGTTTTTATTAGGSGQGGRDSCMAEAVPVSLPDLKMIIMVDRSGSMGNNNTFDPMVSQLDEFLTQRWPSPTAVAINYHPQASNGDNCILANYVPPNIAFTPIPMDASTIVTDLEAQSPGGQSPMSPILEGSLQYATQQQSQAPDTVVVAILLMDTSPNNCDQNIANNADLAANALSFVGVRTYAIALQGFNPVADLDAIALAGGTGQAIDLSTQGATSDLADELTGIRERAVPCEVELPDIPAGATFDADEVLLNYTPSDTMVTETIAQVASADSCGDDGPGWHWDDADEPTKLMLCAATCKAIKQDAAPAVEVVFDCPTGD